MARRLGSHHDNAYLSQKCKIVQYLSQSHSNIGVEQ